jgi:hypothetical protein
MNRRSRLSTETSVLAVTGQLQLNEKYRSSIASTVTFLLDPLRPVLQRPGQVRRADLGGGG